ncbi:MAG: helix-turn-helix transcriptional regulator [Candidatus Cybelea sp.]
MNARAVAAHVMPGNWSQVGAWERNEIRPRLETLLELASLYDVNALELIMWAGHFDELLPAIVAFCTPAIRGVDRRDSVRTVTGSYKVFRWLKWGIALGVRAFPSDARLTVPERFDEYNFAEYPQSDPRFFRHRTRLPGLVQLAKNALAEKRVMPKERRLIAAMYLHAWMRDIDPATYRFVKTMDEQFAADLWRKTLNPLSSTSRRRATIGETS